MKRLRYLIDDAERFPEWLTTVAFYKAVQVIEAVFRMQRGRNCHDHPSRLRALKNPPFPPSLFKNFRVLWSASTVARYLHDNSHDTPYSTFTDYMPANQVVEKVIKKRLIPVEQIALAFLSESGKSSLTQTHL